MWSFPGMPTKNLTLIVPGLFESLAKGDRKINRLKSLETLLVQSNKEKYAGDSLHKCLLDVFDINQAGSGQIPVAALSRFSDCGKCSQCASRRTFIQQPLVRDPFFPKLVHLDILMRSLSDASGSFSMPAICSR